MRVGSLVLLFIVFLATTAWAGKNYPSVLFPQGLISIDQICVADFGATLQTIKPVTYCAKWVPGSKELCNYNADSEVCKSAKLDEVAKVSEIERIQWVCQETRTEILKTSVSYLNTVCQEYEGANTEAGGPCLAWKQQWETWPYKYLYNITQPGEGWFGAVDKYKLPNCQ